MMGRLKSKSEEGAAAHRVLEYTDEEYAALPPGAKALAKAYDVVLGGHLLAVLAGTSLRVKLTRATIAKAEKDAPGTVACSGRAILSIIDDICRPTCGSELEQLEKSLEKPFFSMNMPNVNVRLAALRLEALRGQLPASTRGGNRELLRALIAKFPPELAGEAAKCVRKMCTAEVCKKPYDWTYGELTAILASHISTQSIAEANSTDTIPRGGGGNGNDRLLFTNKFRGCLHCGLDNHETRECHVPPCSYCGLRHCFGLRKRGPPASRECLVKKVVGGGKVTDSDVGYNGRPLPAVLIAQINDKAAKLKQSETNATETQTDLTKDGMDPDDMYAGESDCCELMMDVCC